MSELNSIWLRAADPSRDAVVCPTAGVWTYEKLHWQSRRIRAELERRGVVAGDRVVICAGKSAYYLAAILAILDRGAVYVPIYDRTPAIRVESILRDCEPKIFVADDTGASCAPAEIPVLPIEGVDGDTTTRFEPISNSGSCYLLYTSGSTGVPKGVSVSVASVRHYANWVTKKFSMSSSAVVLSTAPFYFDMSIFDIFATWAVGGTIVLAREVDCLFPVRLTEMISRHGVSHWKGVSSLLQHMAQTGMLDDARLSSLKHIAFGGEAMTLSHIQTWMKKLPGRQFYNAYGPTEATGVSICYAFDTDAEFVEDIPIGHARDGNTIHILRDDLTSCEVLEVGEIAISGAGLADGYWKDPEKTAKAFVELNGERTYLTGDLGYQGSDGLFHFRERKDRQVKIQGYRIELGDVARAATTIECVEDAAAITMTSSAGVTELVLAVATRRPVSIDTIKDELAARLPTYMLPRRIAILSSLPRNDRGKVDIAALKLGLAQK